MVVDASCGGGCHRVAVGYPRDGAPERLGILGGRRSCGHRSCGHHLGSPAPAPTGPIVDWYLSLPYTALKPIKFTTFALTLGGALFLIETANVIVRLALRGEMSASEPEEARAPMSTVRPRRRPLWGSRAPVPERADTTAPRAELKGGRFIGPLERLFLLARILSGAFTAVAALVAAKGIIRFPEISRDAIGGSKAESFLVGSFASWALVMLTVLLIILGATRL